MAGDLILTPLLKTALYPLLTSGVAALAAGKFAKKTEKDWPIAGSMVLGYLVGFFAISGFSRFPPVNVTNWLPYTALFLFPFAFFTAKRSITQRMILACVAASAAIYIQFKPRLQALSTGEFMMWFVIYLALWLLLWFAYEMSADDHHSNDRLIFMVMAATGISMCCMFGSAKMAQLCGVLGSVSGGLFLARLVFPDLSLGSITTGIFVILFGSFLLQVVTYTEISWIAILLIYLSGFAILITRAGFFADLAWWKKIGLAVLLHAPFIAAALIYLAKTVVANEYEYDY